MDGMSRRILKEDMEMRPRQWNRERQTIWDSIPGGILQCSNHGVFAMVEVNQGFLHMFGFTQAELTAQFKGGFLNMVHPSDRRQFAMQTGKRPKKWKTFSLSYRVLCRDGVYKWVASSGKLILVDGEEQMLCVMLDLDGGWDAQEELKPCCLQTEKR